MSKKQREAAKPRGGWGRYGVQLAGIRISAEMRAALATEAKASGVRLSDYVRSILAARAQTDTHIDAQTA